MARPKKDKYSKISDIPVHIFRDRLLCEPVTPELRNYLRHQLNTNEYNLTYLYRRAQEYKDIPGAQYFMPFDRWIRKLRKSLKATEDKDNN